MCSLLAVWTPGLSMDVSTHSAARGGSTTATPSSGLAGKPSRPEDSGYGRSKGSQDVLTAYRMPAESSDGFARTVLRQMRRPKRVSAACRAANPTGSVRHSANFVTDL